MKKKKQAAIRVAVADSDVAMWEAVCEKIIATGEFVISIEAHDGAELIGRLKQKKPAAFPHICVIEVVMHGSINAFETLKELKDTWPEMYVLVFTAIDNEYAVADMMRNGADGYLLKKGHISELIRALRTIYDTGHYDSEIATKSLVHAAKKYGDRLQEIKGPLRIFLLLLAKNCDNKEIVKEMHVSIHTVYGYYKTLKTKLNLKTTSELIKFAHKMAFGGY